MTRAEFDAARADYCTPFPGVEDPDSRLVEVFEIAAAAIVYVAAERLHTGRGSPADDAEMDAAWAELAGRCA